MIAKEIAKIIIKKIKKGYEKIKNINEIPKLREEMKKLLNLERIMKEVANDINNIQEQHQTQINSGVPFEDYKKERDLKDKCESELKNLKEQNKTKEIDFDSEIIKKDILKDLNNDGENKKWVYEAFSQMISGNPTYREWTVDFPNTSIHIGNFINDNKRTTKETYVSYKLPFELKKLLKEIINDWYEKNK